MKSNFVGSRRCSSLLLSPLLLCMTIMHHEQQVKTIVLAQAMDEHLSMDEDYFIDENDHKDNDDNDDDENHNSENHYVVRNEEDDHYSDHETMSLFDDLIWLDNVIDLLKSNSLLAAHGSTTRTVYEEDVSHFYNVDHNTQRRYKYDSPIGQSRRIPRHEFSETLEDDLHTLFGNDNGSYLFDLWMTNHYHDYIVGRPSHRDPLSLKDKIGRAPTAKSSLPPKVYIDKYVKELFELANDPDCTTSQGEIDMSPENLTEETIERAIQVWHKCRYVVLRNILSPDVTTEFRANVTQFVYDLKDGRVNDNGTTTYREPFFLHEVETTRWDMLLPKKFAQNEEVLAHPNLLKIMSDERVLGEQQKCLAFGLVVAEPTAKQQMWHTDTPGLFHDSYMLDMHGFAGHELPTSSIVMFSPLLQKSMDPSHGPTQFCVATHPLNGIGFTEGMADPLTYGGWHMFLDNTLKDRLVDLGGGDEIFEHFTTEYCPPKLWRTLTDVKPGDMVLWDYATIHRAGPNNSTDFRSAIYVSYSRNMVKDLTFEGYRKGDLTFEDTWKVTGRFANIQQSPQQRHQQDDVLQQPTCPNNNDDEESPNSAPATEGTAESKVCPGSCNNNESVAEENQFNRSSTQRKLSLEELRTLFSSKV